MSGTERIAAPCDSARPADEHPLRSALAFYNRKLLRLIWFGADDCDTVPAGTS